MLCGGITNELFKVSSGDTNVLFRIYGAKTDLVIDRQRENNVLSQLTKLNFGPKVYGTVLFGRVEQFLPGRNLRADEMKVPFYQERIAPKLFEMHSLPVELPKIANVWETSFKWLETTMTIRFDDDEEMAKILEEIDLPKVKVELESLRAHIEALPSSSPLAFCHNDLLCGNIMYEKETDTMTFIDFEYGCYNPRAFDIANHFNECCGFDCDWDQFPTKDEQHNWMRHYLAASSKDLTAETVPQADVDALYEEVQPYILLAHLFWGIWAIVQARYSPIAFEFLPYSLLRMKGYQAMKGWALEEKKE